MAMAGVLRNLLTAGVEVRRWRVGECGIQLEDHENHAVGGSSAMALCGTGKGMRSKAISSASAGSRSGCGSACLHSGSRSNVVRLARRPRIETRSTARPVTIFAQIQQEGTERTYIMIKPDGVQRGLVGEIISRFERKGFKLKGLKLFQTPTELAEEHYGELKEKPFYPKLVKYIVSGPVVSMVWEGVGVVASARKLIGVTNPLNAEPGTIRGDLGIQTGRNVIHGSDSPENGEREIALWFKDGELVEWEPTLTPWLLE